MRLKDLQKEKTMSEEHSVELIKRQQKYANIKREAYAQSDISFYAAYVETLSTAEFVERLITLKSVAEGDLPIETFGNSIKSRKHAWEIYKSHLYLNTLVLLGSSDNTLKKYLQDVVDFSKKIEQIDGIECLLISLISNVDDESATEAIDHIRTLYLNDVRPSILSFTGVGIKSDTSFNSIDLKEVYALLNNKENIASKDVRGLIATKLEQVSFTEKQCEASFKLLGAIDGAVIGGLIGSGLGPIGTLTGGGVGLDRGEKLGGFVGEIICPEISTKHTSDTRKESETQQTTVDKTDSTDGNLKIEDNGTGPVDGGTDMQEPFPPEKVETSVACEINPEYIYTKSPISKQQLKTVSSFVAYSKIQSFKTLSERFSKIENVFRYTESFGFATIKLNNALIATGKPAILNLNKSVDKLKNLDVGVRINIEVVKDSVRIVPSDVAHNPKNVDLTFTDHLRAVDTANKVDIGEQVVKDSVIDISNVSSNEANKLKKVDLTVTDPRPESDLLVPPLPKADASSHPESVPTPGELQNKIGETALSEIEKIKLLKILLR